MPLDRNSGGGYHPCHKSFLGANWSPGKGILGAGTNDILQPLHRPQKQQGVQVVNLPAVCNQHQLQVSLWTVCLPAFDIATQLKACLLQEVKRSAAQKSQLFPCVSEPNHYGSIEKEEVVTYSIVP
uniref:Uncharacterized protein n=2 Tax=Oryza TaxID=4527 RepID=A0A0E0QKU5_ORYRU